MDRDYQPFNLSSIEDSVSLKTIFDNGDESWSQNSPLSNVHLNVEDVTVSESTTEDLSVGLKNEEATPILSPLITEVIAEDSGCDLHFEPYPSGIHADENRGKDHLFTKLLTSFDEEASVPLQQLQTEIAIRDQQHNADCESSPESTSPPTIADIVAQHRQLMDSSSGAPSSGYGTMDGYKYSTTASEVSRDYLARKLQDVEETETDLDSIHESLSNESSTGGIETHTGSQDHTTHAATQDQLSAISEPQNCSQDNGHLPSLLLTPPQPPTNDTDTRSMTKVPSVSSLHITNSASTGDLSSGSSYYQDNEGYLHMAPSHTGLNPRLHKSSDMLAKSL